MANLEIPTPTGWWNDDEDETSGGPASGGILGGLRPSYTGSGLRFLIEPKVRRK